MAQVLSTANQLSFPSRISARGIIAGVLSMLAIDMLMLSFGAGIGLSAFHPNGGAERGVAIWGVIWFFISVSAGGFFGAWVACGASGAAQRRDAIMHAFVTWAAATVLAGFFLVELVSRTAGLAASAGNVLAQMAPNAGQAAQGTLSNVNPQQLRGGAGTVADVLGLSSWALFVAMALSAIFSIIGGIIGGGLEHRSGAEVRAEVPHPGHPGGTLPVA